MRQIRSLGSAKAIYLNRPELLRQLKELAQEAMTVFPEILEIRLIGSLASGTQTGTSDIDLLIIIEKPIQNPVADIRPYFFFFSKRLNIGLDILMVRKDVPVHFKKTIQNSLILACRG